MTAVERLAGLLQELLPAGPATVIVDRVRLTASPVPGPMGAHLRTLASEALARRAEVTVIDEERTEELVARLTAYLAEEFDSTTTPRLGNFCGARFLLEGSYLEMEGELRLSLQLREIATRRLAPGSPRALLIAKEELPRLACEPSNAERVNLQLGRWQAEASAGFPLDVWTDRGIGGRYRPGEPLRIFVRSGVGGRLLVEHMSTSGKVQPVFPNPFHQGERVAGRRVLEIPGEEMAFEMTVAGEEGGEMIRAKCVADDGRVATRVIGYTIVR